MNSASHFCNKVIEYCFYTLFLITPLVFVGDTSELFEFNKMWFVFILTIIIGVAWIAKVTLTKTFRLQKTPLDIPIMLFLASQIIATFHSLDTHISLWGYYSRFNGGLLSITAYIFLYYAFVSNFIGNENERGAHLRGDATGGSPTARKALERNETRLSTGGRKEAAGPRSNNYATKLVRRFLYLSVLGGTIVALWGFPSHFGYDPTCLLFRGTFDVACWTDAFQPKIRIFSTMGQPDWMAAYMTVILPIHLGLGLYYLLLKRKKLDAKQNFKFFSGYSFQNDFYSIMMFILSGAALLAFIDIFISVSPLFVDSTIRNLTFLVINIGFIPLYLILSIKFHKTSPIPIIISLITLTILFYLDLTYTDSKSGFLGVWLALGIFGGGLLFLIIRQSIKTIADNFVIFSIVAVMLGLFTFFIGTPVYQLDPFTYHGIMQKFQKPATSQTTQQTQPEPPRPIYGALMGGTDSGRIRQIVWQGALDAWRHNLVFGTGVETFAFAYYKHRPVEHNLVSEWDYLYNKAHNEYLNFLVTTGIFGLGTNLLLTFWFLFLFVKGMLQKLKLSEDSDESVTLRRKVVVASLVAAYASILFTNFFGFSVVMINVYFFLIPAFVMLFLGLVNPALQFVVTSQQARGTAVALWQTGVVILAIIVGSYAIFTLGLFWLADKSYGLGYNLNRAGRYVEANPYLVDAVQKRPSEPVFVDELSFSDAVMALAYGSENNATQASILAKEAVALSNNVIASHPNNVVFWKTRVKVLHALADIDKSLAPLALDAISKAHELAPTDAKVMYSYGVLLWDDGQGPKAVEIMEQTTKAKPDYREAHYALGLYYRALATDKNGKVISPEFQQKAVDELHFILEKIDPTDENAKKVLEQWGTK